MINKISKEDLSSKINEIKKLEFDKDSKKIFCVFSDYSIGYMEFKHIEILNNMLEESDVISITCSEQISLRMDDSERLGEKGLISIWQEFNCIFKLQFENGKTLMVAPKDANLDIININIGK